MKNSKKDTYDDIFLLCSHKICPSFLMHCWWLGSLDRSMSNRVKKINRRKTFSLSTNLLSVQVGKSPSSPMKGDAKWANSLKKFSGVTAIFYSLLHTLVLHQVTILLWSLSWTKLKRPFLSKRPWEQNTKKKLSKNTFHQCGYKNRVKNERKSFWNS